MLGWPHFWLDKAKELDRAANIILQSVHQDLDDFRQSIDEVRNNPGGPFRVTPRPLMETSFFLGALALENLLKSLYIQAHNECLRDGKLRGDVVTNHELKPIADALKLSLDGNEQLLLEMGSDAIVSWGRYPLPRNVGH